MSHADFMRTSTGIICGLQSLNTYLDARSSGVPPMVASANFAGNLFNGLARNEVAYEMAKAGNPVGNIINMYSGYGNPVSNAVGTMGLMTACSPWMFFNSPCCYSPMMYGGFGMGYTPFMNPMMGWGMGGFYC